MTPTSSRRKAVTALIRFLFGPWEPRIWLIFVGLLLVELAQTSTGLLFGLDSWRPVVLNEPLGRLPSLALLPFVTLVRAGLGALVFWAIHKFVRLVTRQVTLTRASYLLMVAMAAILICALRFRIFGMSPFEDPSHFLLACLVTIVLVLIFLGAVGTMERGYDLQVQRADDATAVVIAQRTAVIQAEEAAREVIARQLHDKVQAGLVAASLHLRQALAEATSDIAERIDSVSAELERIRVEEVRAAAQRLSPNFALGGLAGAVESLGQGYAPGMDVLVDDTSAAESWNRVRGSGVHDVPAPEVMLGVYRVIEQALLNAAVHGRAAHVIISISSDSDALDVAIIDDGCGLSPKVIPGTGQAVIDSWVGMLGGTWELRLAEPGGVTVAVRLPLGR